MEWYLKVLRQYADFNGRARRKEYWMFILINILISIAVIFMDFILFNAEVGYGFLYVLYSLGMFIPSLAVAVRRLHDVNKSGWWFLILFIPIIGSIWLLILVFTDGTPGANQYGLNPKEIEM